MLDVFNPLKGERWGRVCEKKEGDIEVRQRSEKEMTNGAKCEQRIRMMGAS